MGKGQRAYAQRRPLPAGPAPRLSSVRFVGHATVEIELGGTRLLTDPLLGPRLGPLLRRGAQPDAQALAGVDAVLVSHMHHDHLDLPSLRRLGRPVIAAKGAADFMRRKGIADVRGLGRGDSLQVGPVKVTAIQAAHPGSRYGRGSGGAEALGFLLEGPERVYFAGDTELFDEMAELAGRVDLALIPIWGWGPKLGPGHLDPLTAAEAVKLIAPKVAVPIHWGTLSPPGSSRLWPWLLTEPGERFVAATAAAAPEVEVRVLRPGEATGIG